MTDKEIKEAIEVLKEAQDSLDEQERFKESATLAEAAAILDIAME